MNFTFNGCIFYTALENQPHYEAYQHALKEGVEISLKYVKFLFFFGPPQTGKTSMRHRLVGEIQNLVKEPVQTSTGTSEHHDVIVKLVEEKISDKITASTTVITKSKWSAVKALFGKEKVFMRQTWMKNCGFSIVSFMKLLIRL